MTVTVYGFVLGKVSLTTAEPGNGLNARSFLKKPRILGTLSGGGSIWGISVLNSELFVVRGGWLSVQQVNVYNTNNFTWTRNITITGSSTLCCNSRQSMV